MLPTLMLVSIPLTLAELFGMGVMSGKSDFSLKSFGFDNSQNVGNKDIYYLKKGEPLYLSLQAAPVKQITGGAGFTVILQENGDIWTFGAENTYGELGYDDPSCAYCRPTLLNRSGLAKPIAIATGSAGLHTLVLLDDGAVRCFGNNLGTSKMCCESTKKFCLLTDPGWVNSSAVAIGAGTSHSIIIIDTGAVKLRGNNEHYVLGTSTAASEVTLSNGLPIIKAGCGGRKHTTLLSEDGGLVTFGKFEQGVYGAVVGRDCTPQDYCLPAVLPSTPKFMEISCGEYHTMAKTAADDIYVFGVPLNVGLPFTYFQPTFTTKKGQRIVAARAHSAIITGGERYLEVWGSNEKQQLGKPTATASINTPTRVVATTGNPNTVKGVTDVFVTDTATFYVAIPSTPTSPPSSPSTATPTLPPATPPPATPPTTTIIPTPSPTTPNPTALPPTAIPAPPTSQPPPPSNNPGIPPNNKECYLATAQQPDISIQCDTNNNTDTSDITTHPPLTTCVIRCNSTSNYTKGYSGTIVCGDGVWRIGSSPKIEYFNVPTTDLLLATVLQCDPDLRCETAVDTKVKWGKWLASGCAGTPHLGTCGIRCNNGFRLDNSDTLNTMATCVNGTWLGADNKACMVEFPDEAVTAGVSAGGFIATTATTMVYSSGAQTFGPVAAMMASCQPASVRKQASGFTQLLNPLSFVKLTENYNINVVLKVIVIRICSTLICLIPVVILKLKNKVSLWEAAATSTLLNVVFAVNSITLPAMVFNSGQLLRPNIGLGIVFLLLELVWCIMAPTIMTHWVISNNKLTPRTFKETPLLGNSTDIEPKFNLIRRKMYWQPHNSAFAMAWLAYMASRRNTKMRYLGPSVEAALLAVQVLLASLPFDCSTIAAMYPGAIIISALITTAWRTQSSTAQFCVHILGQGIVGILSVINAGVALTGFQEPSKTIKTFTLVFLIFGFLQVVAGSIIVGMCVYSLLDWKKRVASSGDDEIAVEEWGGSAAYDDTPWFDDAEDYEHYELNSVTPEDNFG